MARRKSSRKPVSLPCLPRHMRGGQYQIEAVTFVGDEGDKIPSPNGAKRARRIDLAEKYAKPPLSILDARQVKAARLLRDAYEATHRTAPAIKAVQVDSSPKPDSHVDIMIDRISKFSAIMRHVPDDCRDVVSAVALDNEPIASLKAYRGRKHTIGARLLRKGLDAVALSMQC